MDRSESAVRKWLRHDAWAFTLTGPWEIEKVRAWAEIQLKPDPAAAYRAKARRAAQGKGEFDQAGPLGRVRIQYMIERALAVRQRRLRDAGQLHDVRKCRHRRMAQIHALKGRLLELPRLMASPLADQDAETIERELTREIHGMLAEFAAEVGEATQTTDAAETGDGEGETEDKKTQGER